MYKIFVNGIQPERSYRSLDKARIAQRAAIKDNPGASVVLRSFMRLRHGYSGWSNVDDWVEQAIRLA